MDRIDHIFGQPIERFKEICVITPFLFSNMLKDLRVHDFRRGSAFSSGSSERLTLIQAGIGATLAGEAALLLKGSPCRRIIFTGSCGAIEETRRIQIGSVAQVHSVYQMESFSQMLTGGLKPQAVAHNLAALFKDIPPVVACSVGSISMENAYLPEFKACGIQVVDLEVSSVMSAAQKIGIEAHALLYVSDAIDPASHPFLTAKEPSLKLLEAQQKIIRCLNQL
ncbi:MAG TPA: hypothetical protein P5246_06900 [Candidatus Omnitrophota bacterium]|nr:hypothetical protein [Candidatus Omnitrophota bacterium]HSA31669.1 hypothetical protein [Candidatus Omnitrophota bacterium]